MTKLHGIEVPSHYNGVGLHDTPGAETATWDYSQSVSHAQELRAHGVTLYKLFGSGTKGSRAQAYRDRGILILHRWWPGGAHWGRPPADWLMPRADYDHLLSSGVSLFEPGWNEFNIAEEWATPIPYASGIARAVVDAWEEAGTRYGSYEHLLFPSNTPGGNVDHRVCYQAIAAEISNRGLAATVQHVAIHPRPLNNPPNITWSSTNTCTFDEWRWIRDRFRAVGVDAYYWATEHGYSIDYNENAEYPPMNLTSWTDYNWDLFTWMNPAHQQAIDRDLAGVTYWFNAGWGHWGFWARDALVDSPAPEMPAPSPLWVRMGNQSGALAFSRYEGVEPPPPPERARGLDVSQFSGTINWDLAGEDFDFVMIRFSGPNADRSTCIVDVQAEANYARAGAAGLLRGGYHGLMQDPTGQAKLFVDAVGGRPLELGYWGDFEGAVTDAKAAAFLEAADRNLAAWGVERPVCDVYTGLGWLSGKAAAWAPGRDLWLASWTYDPDSNPRVPVQWEGRGWAFLQYSNLGSVPGVPYRVCLDVFDGTEDELYEIYKPDGGENGGDDVIEVVDRNGNPVVVDGVEWTWESAQRDFGLSLTRAEPPTEATLFRLVRVIYDGTFESNWNLCVVDEDGSPLPGIAVFMGILPDSGQALDPDQAPRLTEEFWGQPEGRPNRALVLQPNELNFTNELGRITHSLGSGSNYVAPVDGGSGGGTHWAWVMAGQQGWYSDVPAGFGMFREHRMFWPVFQRVTVTDPEPPPPPPPETGSYHVTGTISLDSLKFDVDLLVEPVVEDA